MTISNQSGQAFFRLQDLPPLCQNASAVLVIADKKASAHHRQTLESALPAASSWLTLSSGEANKSTESLFLCWKRAAEQKLDRRSLIIGFGGGAVNDLAAFTASTYMRGIAYLAIPSTLLAMVDASIGGKTGINFNGVKNLIGSFHTPEATFLHLPFLKTLPMREYKSGIAEIIKAAIIDGGDFFHRLEAYMPALLKQEMPLTENIIRRAVQIKQEIVLQDYKEEGIRALLNYGHTFAHALESISQYKRFLHGEAVAIGMSSAAALAEELKLCSSSFRIKQDTLIQAAGLPTALPDDISNKELISGNRIYIKPF